MFLSTKAYNLLVTSSNVTVCKEPGFADLETIEFTPFDGGKYYSDERCFIVVFSATPTTDALMVHSFYRTGLSNFSKIDEVAISCRDPKLTPQQLEILDKINNVKLGCNEKRYKLACTAFHLNPKDDSLNEANLNVFEAVLNAAEPKKAKFATHKLANFNKAWDLPENARDAMDWAQMNRIRDPKTHKFYMGLAKLAWSHNIRRENVFFAEATADVSAVEGTPATTDAPAIEATKGEKADRIWGTGVGIEPLLASFLKEGNTIPLVKTLRGDKKLGEFTPLYDGKNGLGLSIQVAFGCFCGNDYECIQEEMLETIDRIQEYDGFSFFKYEPETSDSEEPEAKRSCSRESPEPELIGRSFSCSD